MPSRASSSVPSRSSAASVAGPDDRALLHDVPCGLLSVSLDGTLVNANLMAARLLGLPVERLHGLPFERLLSDDARALFEHSVPERLTRHGAIDEIHTALRTASGRTVPVVVRAVREPNNPAAPLQLAFLPVRHRRALQSALEDARRGAAAAAAHHAVAAREVVDLRARLADAERRVASLQAALTAVHTAQAAQPRPAAAAGPDGEGSADVAAMHDPLTGLASTVLFDDRAAQALALAARHDRRAAVLHVRLVGEAERVARHGAAVGDRLLQDIALRLCGALRASDSISRTGDDGFVVMLTDVIQPGQVALVTEKLVGLLQRPYDSVAGPLRIAVRVGIAMFPDDGDEIATLRREAAAIAEDDAEDAGDARDHDAGEDDAGTVHPEGAAGAGAADAARDTTGGPGAGGSAVEPLADLGPIRFRSASLHRRAAEYREMHLALNRALERGEFRVVWQPDVSIRTGRVAGVEALLRWQHPTLGMLAPAQFLEAAEASGLIVPIGAWVMREACRQGRAWMDEGGEKLPITVNVSGAQLRDPALADHVGAALQASGLRPQLLSLEVPESALAHGYDDLQRLLARAVVLGVRVSIDDFGTGSASITDLKHLPVSTLKLDAAFVRGAPEDPGAAAVLEAVIRMARQLKRRVVAEGVERQAQAHWLGAHGCTLMQGHLFGTARTTDEMTALLRGQWGPAADASD